MANADQLKKASELIEEILQMPVAGLVQNPSWGSLNFNDAQRNLEQIHGIAGHLKELPIELIPDSPMNTVLQGLTSARDACNQIRNFSLDRGGNPRDERNSFAQSARSAADNLLMATANWIPFLAYQRGDVQRNIEQLRSAVGQAQQELGDAQSDIGNKKNEIAEIIQAAREASATVGVGHFTSDFSGEADTLKTEADFWLKWTAGLGVATVLAALGSAFFPLPADATSAHVVHLMTSKVVLLVALLAATIWCGRIYKATMHQAVTNKHRANSLKTFQAFVKAAADNTTRDAVLLETTRSIFALAPSGYLDASEPAMDTGTKVLEIFKGRSGAAPGG